VHMRLPSPAAARVMKRFTVRDGGRAVQAWQCRRQAPERRQAARLAVRARHEKGAARATPQKRSAERRASRVRLRRRLRGAPAGT